MQTKMQFQKNAEVITANGESIGQIDRVVVNPENNVVTHLVVHKGTLFNPQDKLVPVELVTETSPEQIVLHYEAGDLESFPPFEEERIVDFDEDADRESLSEEWNVHPLIYGSPAIGVPVDPGIGASGDPGVGEKFNTHIEQNIPKGTVAMKEGAKVMTADGKHVGNVERVLTDIPEEQITHLLISKGMFAKTTKLIPIDWVERVNEDEVNLAVNKVSVDKLADTSSRS
jgi:sporulation protein YlmC with PRC-barrel domain